MPSHRRGLSAGDISTVLAHRVARAGLTQAFMALAGYHLYHEFFTRSQLHYVGCLDLGRGSYVWLTPPLSSCCGLELLINRCSVQLPRCWQAQVKPVTLFCRLCRSSVHLCSMLNPLRDVRNLRLDACNTVQRFLHLTKALNIEGLLRAIAGILPYSAQS